MVTDQSWYGGKNIKNHGSLCIVFDQFDNFLLPLTILHVGSDEVEKDINGEKDVNNELFGHVLFNIIQESQGVQFLLCPLFLTDFESNMEWVYEVTVKQTEVDHEFPETEP